MRIVITAREALDKGVWLEICNLKGFSEWAINEGQMEPEEEIELSEEEARKLGLLS